VELTRRCFRQAALDELGVSERSEPIPDSLPTGTWVLFAVQGLTLIAALVWLALHGSGIAR
jgi:hypothetical protein